jgi:HK97 family phage portal protein
LGIISHLASESRASVVNPVHPRDPALPALFRLGESNAAGVEVTAQRALAVTAFYAGINILSETIAMLPLSVYEKLERGRKPVNDHPVNLLLDLRPNPTMSPFTFKKLIRVHRLIWGNFYAEIERDNGGRPIALWPLDPTRVEPKRLENEKVFLVDTGKGPRLVLSADRILHIPGLGSDGLRGYSVIAIHAASLGMTIATDDYGARYYANDAKPSGILTWPGNPSRDQRTDFREDWQRVHGGLTGSHRLAVLWGGMTYQPLSFPPEDSQFLQTRSFQIEEIARILNVNPILLQHHEKATTWGSGVEQFMLAYRMLTVQPLCTQDEDEINWALFNEAEHGKLFVKYNLDALLRGDSLTRAQVNQIKRQNGIINADEWREQDEELPLPEGQGEVYTIPLNFQDMMTLLDPPEPPAPVVMPALGPEAEPEEEEPQEEDERQLKLEERSTARRNRLQKAHMKLFANAAGRYVRRDTTAFMSAVEKAFATPQPLVGMERFIREFYPGQEKYIFQTMLPVVSALGAIIAAEAASEVGHDGSFDLDDFAMGYTEGLAIREVGASIGQIRTIIKNTELAEDLKPSLLTRAGEWNEKRPDKVAANEIIRVGGAFARAAWQQSGISALIWRANPTACPICQDMDGRRVGSTGYFARPGDAVGDEANGTPLVVDNSVANPPLHEGCECTIEADAGRALAPAREVRRTPAPAPPRARGAGPPIIINVNANRGAVRLERDEYGRVTRQIPEEALDAD